MGIRLLFSEHPIWKRLLLDPRLRCQTLHTTLALVLYFCEAETLPVIGPLVLSDLSYVQNRLPYP